VARGQLDSFNAGYGLRAELHRDRVVAVQHQGVISVSAMKRIIGRQRVSQDE